MRKFLASLLILVSLTVPSAYAAGDYHGTIDFEPLRVEQAGLSICPGQTSSHISELKDVMRTYGLVEYSQMRTDTEDYFDAKFAALVETLCDFCGYDNPECIIDDSVNYIINHYGEMTKDMQSDIKQAYLKRLMEKNICGIIAHDGTAYPYYAWTQTDKDWADVAYPYGSDYSRTMSSSACGPTSMSIILSSWLHREILPTEIAQYSVKNGHRASSGTSASLFLAAANAYDMPKPVTVYGSDINEVYAGVLNNGNMAIANMRYGHFTHGGHYIALVGAKEINGKQYFLVADPNYPNRSYYGYGTDIIDDYPSDPFVWASASVIKNECKDICWFKADFKSFTPQYVTSESETMLARFVFAMLPAC